MFSTVELATDGGFIVGGYTGSYLGGSTGYWLVYLNGAGDALRTKVFVSNIEEII